MHRTLAILAVVALSACGTDAGGTSPAGTTPATGPTSSPATTQTAQDTAAGSAETPTTTGASTTLAATDPVTTARRHGAVAFGALGNMAIVSTTGRVVVLRDGALGEPVDGLLAADGETLIATDVAPDRSSTTVTWLGLRDGVTQDSFTLGGDLRAIATDPSAKVVALTAASRPGVAAQTASTEIVITGRRGELFRHTYTTELLPEGFSNVYADESGELPAGLFVIEYLDPPPTEAGAPRRYRVRVVDTLSGELALPLNLRDKTQTVDEQMLGFGRTHVLSPRNGLLFTLYRGLDEDEAGYAFVHTLGFVNGVWCLDLPVSLDLGDLPGALTLVDDERTLVVASANGYMTEFAVSDITDLSVHGDPAPRRTLSVWSAPGRTDGPALASAGRTILAGQGGELRWIDAGTWTVVAALAWDMQIEAVALTPGGNAIAAGTRRVSEITADGQLAAEVPLPGGFGTVARIVLIGA